MPALAAANRTAMPPAPSYKLTALGETILLRCAVPAGATRAELMRDVRAITNAGLAMPLWRAQADLAIAELVEQGLVTESRSRLKATPQGTEQAATILGAPVTVKMTWGDMRDGPLVALALGVSRADRAAIKSLANADTLRAVIVQQAFGLGTKPLSLGKLRASLAVRALERAFGNQIKSGLGAGTGLAAKPSRVLAGQLSKSPRDYGSDGRLIAALASEALGTPNSELETLKLALLRRHFKERSEAQARRSKTLTNPSARATAHPSPQPTSLLTVANDTGQARQLPLPAARPDLAGFIRVVQLAAAKRAEGWPGSRKAFICHVFEEINSSRPTWALSEIEFKAMLAEAHRTGALALATADLKDKKHMQVFEKSAIQFKNTVLHSIRVEEQ